MRLESSKSLFQPPSYQALSGDWHPSLSQAMAKYQGPMKWDPTAVLSLLSFGYICGDRTLLREVKRLPWLSQIDGSGNFIYESIPAHGYHWSSADKIADHLFDKLCIEAEYACHGRDNLYILLSGGLDSRIIGGILAHLYRENRIQHLPQAICWGIPNSRDVALSNQVAQSLGFPWTFVELCREDFCNNIHLMATHLGASASPQHLHRMGWFETVAPDSLVIAGSYGDSVGRSEYGGRHLLELKHLNPGNTYHLMPDELFSSSLVELQADIHAIGNRAGRQPTHVECEYERQAHYMRSGLATTMSVINRYCHVYQMFTSPEVFGYMWALHPSARTDEVYRSLLKKMGHPLASIPWARTARSLMSSRRDRVTEKLLPSYHNYRQWISETFSERYASQDIMDWWLNTGLFGQDALDQFITNTIEKDELFRIYGLKPYEFLAWLMSFYEFGQTVQIQEPPTNSSSNIVSNTLRISNEKPLLSRQLRMRQWLWGTARSSKLARWLIGKGRSIRRAYYRFHAKKNFPPNYDEVH